MSKFSNIEEFEQAFKQQSQAATTPPPVGGWEAVSSAMGSGSTGLAGLSSTFSTISGVIKVALFVGGVLATVGILYQSNKSSGNNEGNNAPSGIISEVDNSDEPLEFYADTNSTGLETKQSKTGKTSTVNNELPKLNNNSVQSPVNDNVSSKTPFTGGTNPTELAKVDEATEKSQSAKLTLNFSNYKPCQGEIIELSNSKNISGNWFVNGKKIAGNTGKTNYKCVDSKEIKVNFESDQYNLSKTLPVSTLNTSIVKNENSDGSFSFGLSKKELISNWYVDGKLILTNSPELSHTFMEVGMHQVKAVPVNHACSAELIEEITIEPTGKIEVDNIFTPNGDGKNDVYQVRIENYTNFSIQIFTSRLVKVFASNDPNIGWNGRINNQEQECADGEYIARISYQLKGEKPVIKNVRLRLQRNNNN